MFHEFLAKTSLTVWPILAFILFFATFLGVCAAIVTGIYRRQNLSRVAALPLEDDDLVEGSAP
jgi:hypothetical protein